MFLTHENMVDDEFYVLFFIVVSRLLYSHMRMLQKYRWRVRTTEMPFTLTVRRKDSQGLFLLDFCLACCAHGPPVNCVATMGISLVLWGCRRQTRLGDSKRRTICGVWLVLVSWSVTVPEHLLSLLLALLPVEGFKTVGVWKSVFACRSLKKWHNVTAPQFPIMI